MRTHSLLSRGLALIGLGAAVALVVPTATLAQAPGDVPIPTVVYIHSIGSTPLDYGDTIYLRGQVFYTDPDDGKDYAAEGTAVLDRQLAGESGWTTMDSDDMSVFYPVFSFSTTAKANAVYRVTFPGDDRYAPSSDSLVVKVARNVTAKITEPRENVFYLSGRVSPSYAGRPVTLLRQKCSSCAWRAYTTKASTASSTYRFRLPLPESGTHYFRARVPGELSFVKSFSPIYQLMRLF